MTRPRRNTKVTSFEFDFKMSLNFREILILYSFSILLYGNYPPRSR